MGRQWDQDLSRFKPYGTTRATNILIKKINWNWGIFAWWNWGSKAAGQKKKRFNAIVGIIDTSLFTSSAITGGTSIPAFASGVGVAIGAALGGMSEYFSLSAIATWKYSRSLTVKQGKHNAIKLLALSKLDSIADIISQAMQDGEISPTEFHKVLQKIEKYRKLKADIRNQTKAKVKQIEKEQREEILEQGRKEGKSIF